RWNSSVSTSRSSSRVSSMSPCTGSRTTTVEEPVRTIRRHDTAPAPATPPRGSFAAGGAGPAASTRTPARSVVEAELDRGGDAQPPVVALHDLAARTHDLDGDRDDRRVAEPPLRGFRRAPRRTDGAHAERTFDAEVEPEGGIAVPAQGRQWDRADVRTAAPLEHRRAMPLGR